MQDILDILADTPMTAAQLAASTGISPRTVYRILKDLHTQKLIHIESRHRKQQGKGGAAAVWATGKKKDAPLITQAEACKRWRDRTRLKRNMASINSPFAQLIAYTTKT